MNGDARQVVSQKLWPCIRGWGRGARRVPESRVRNLMAGRKAPCQFSSGWRCGSSSFEPRPKEALPHTAQGESLLIQFP